MFRFKQFAVIQRDPVFKIGTDSTLLGAATPLNNPQHALEIGSGSGIISMMIAQRSPSTTIQAIDILAEACDLSKENFEASPFSNRLEALHCPLSEFIPNTNFDLIFSNPPFFKNSLLGPNDAKNAARHTIELSFEEIFAFAENNLSENGQLSLIVPAENLDYFVELSRKHGFDDYDLTLIRNKESKPYKRMIFNAFRRVEKSYERDFDTNQEDKTAYLTLRKADDTFTSEYCELTRNFHPFL